MQHLEDLKATLDQHARELDDDARHVRQLRGNLLNFSQNGGVEGEEGEEVVIGSGGEAGEGGVGGGVGVGGAVGTAGGAPHPRPNSGERPGGGMGTIPPGGGVRLDHNGPLLHFPPEAIMSRASSFASASVPGDSPGLLEDSPLGPGNAEGAPWNRASPRRGPLGSPRRLGGGSGSGRLYPGMSPSGGGGGGGTGGFREPWMFEDYQTSSAVTSPALSPSPLSGRPKSIFSAEAEAR